jgi:hypothetical protein
MVSDLLAAPGAAQESEVFAFVSDVEADQRMEIDRMGAMLAHVKEHQRTLEQDVGRLSGRVRLRRHRIRMRAKIVWFAAAVMIAAVAVGAQSKDPRVGLKPGLRDAGEAAKGMEKIASLFKPEGFFDPKVPAGTRRRRSAIRACRRWILRRRRIRGSRTCSRSPIPISRSAATHLFLGSFHGFNTYDIERRASRS